MKESYKKIRILEYILSFGEYQNGRRTIGVSYSKRNGWRLSNWKVGLIFLLKINISIDNAHDDLVSIHFGSYLIDDIFHENLN